MRTWSALQSFITSQRSRGHIWSVAVLHDSWCNGPDRCNCKPEYTAQPVAADEAGAAVLTEGARLTAELVKSKLS